MSSLATEEDRSRLERCTGYAGLAFVVLILPAIATELLGPDATKTPAEVTAAFASARTDVLVSSALLIGAITAFFVFAMGVAELARSGDRVGLLTALARASAVIGIALVIAYTAIFASLAASIDRLHDVDAVYGIFRAAGAIDSSQDLFVGLFMVTSALPLARAGLTGRWFMRFALFGGTIYAVGCFAMTSASEGAFMHFEVIGTLLLIIWAAVLSIRLVTRRAASGSPAHGGTTMTGVRTGAVLSIVLAALLLPVAGWAQSPSEAKPLALTGRVLHAGDLPGFAPSGRPAAVANVAAWNKIAPSGGIDVAAQLSRAGFVAAVREDLGWAKGSDRGALSAVVRLRSAKAARAEIAQEVRNFADLPGRGRVKTSEPFAVPGIPGSNGWTATGTDGTRGHNIIFADGPFIYHLGVGWGAQAKDPPTRAQLIDAATKLYKRVHGRPAPGS
jgi:hypothetical protein